VQVGDVLHLNVVLDGHSGRLVVNAQGDSAVCAVADQAHEAVVASDLGGDEVVGGSVLLLSDVVFLGDGDMRTGGAIEQEVIACMG
jgi:hypothetical protein